MRRCAAVAFFVLCGCGEARSVSGGPVDTSPVFIAQAFAHDPLPGGADIRDAAAWRGPGGARWVIATATNNTLVVFDATTGRIVRTVGRAGVGIGELKEPDGIAVLGDSIVLVAEHGNARVQGFHVPDFTSVGTFGDKLVEGPSSIAAAPASNAYSVYVADNRTAGFARIVQFRLTVGNGELIAIHWRTFGDTLGPGALRDVKTLAADVAHDRLIVGDADRDTTRARVFDLSGHDSRQVMLSVTEAHHNAHVILQDCGGGRGYWIASTAADSALRFYVVDRASLVEVGRFSDSARMRAASACRE